MAYLFNMSILLRQPFWLLEHIVDEVDLHEDLLSLALCCAQLSTVIIPEHLSYRRVVISVYFQPFFDHITSYPGRAGRVRELTLVNSGPELVVPRAYAFHRAYPESRLLFASGYDDDFLHDNHDAHSEPESRPFNASIAKLDTSLSRLPRLRRLHFRGHIPFLPVERILRTHYSQLEGFATDSMQILNEIGEEDGPFPSPSSRLWGMSGLRALELATLLSCHQWNLFCAFLARSPQMEILEIPVFKIGVDDRADMIPPLPCLQRVAFHNRRGGPGDVYPSRIYDLLNDHPAISEVSWKGSYSGPAQMPVLPAAVRLFNINQHHVMDLLRRAAPVVYKRSLDTVVFSCIDSHPQWTWARLRLAFPSSLRALHIHALGTDVEGYEMLEGLSNLFLQLKELRLPRAGSVYRVRLTAEERRAYPRGQAPESVLRTRMPTLDEILARFHVLHTVSGVDADAGLLALEGTLVRGLQAAILINLEAPIFIFLNAAKKLAHIESQYPRLREVNGWRLDTELSRQVVFLPMSDAADLPGVVFELTPNGVRVRYRGTRLDSQPFPLKCTHPRPVPRTYYLDD